MLLMGSDTTWKRNKARQEGGLDLMMKVLWALPNGFFAWCLCVRACVVDGWWKGQWGFSSAEVSPHCLKVLYPIVFSSTCHMSTAAVSL